MNESHLIYGAKKHTIPPIHKSSYLKLIINLPLLTIYLSIYIEQIEVYYGKDSVTEQTSLTNLCQ